jgi:predicted permease
MTIFDDLRLASRALARTPVFALTAIVTLALGIGANTLIFSLVHGVVLKPLPFKEPGRVVSVTATARHEAVDLPTRISEREFDQWRRSSTALEKIAIYRLNEFTVTGHGEPELAHACLVSEDFFDTLGTAPILGRGFAPEDAERAVLVLSHDTWRHRFGGSDPLGRTLQLDGRPYTIVGVMPHVFAFPSRDAALWVPRRSVPGETNLSRVGRYGMIARLTSGATIDGARAEAAVIWKRLEATNSFSKGGRALVGSLQDAIVGDVRRGLLVLLAAVSAVLLVACVNVGSLCLARGGRRQGELALRSALGASRGRLVRALLAEGIVLVSAGTLVAWALAAALLPATVSIVAPDTPRLADVALDLPVLAFTLAASVLTVLLVGLLPAWRVSRTPFRDLLVGQGGTTTSARTGRLRAALTGVQAAVSILVLVSAVLFVRTLGALLDVESDHAGDSVLTLGVTLPPPAYGNCGAAGSHDANCEARERAFARDVLARVRRLGGVQSAALTTSLPPNTAEMSFTLPVRNQATGGLEAYKFNPVVVAGDYFGALGIGRLRGRVFDSRDAAGSTPVFVVGRDFARRQFGSEDVVGRQMPFGPPDAKGMPTPATVIGVVDDVRYSGLDRPAGGSIYFPYSHQPYSTFYVVVRTTGPHAAVAAALRTTVRAVDPRIPVSHVRTLNQLRHASVADPASRATILGALAAVALLLVGVGLYANSSDMTRQRTFEIGVRMALGADARATVGMLVSAGLAPVGVGLAIGLGAAAALSRFVGSLLFGVQPTDPLTYGTATALLALVAAVAVVGPARRAVRIDPALALKGSAR